MSTQKNIKNVIFPMSVLHIQLDTNTGPNGESRVELFKRTMIKMPKMDVAPIFDSEFPYFTKNVEYPKSIERADWKTKYEFFFNRRVFLDRLRKDIDRDESIFAKPIATEEEEAKEKEYNETVEKIEKENVMITLRCLFPIPEVFGKTLKNTYDHILKPNGNDRIFKDVNVLSSLNIFGFMYKFGIVKKEKQEYFINIGGKRYMVDNVIWENDFVNHPIYKKFLLAQRNVYEEVEVNEYNLRKKKNVVEEELRTLLAKNSEMQGADLTDEKPEEIQKKIDELERSSLELIRYKPKILNGYLKKASSNNTNTKESDQNIVIKKDDLKSIEQVINFKNSPIYLSVESYNNTFKYLIPKLNEIDAVFSYLDTIEKKSESIKKSIKNTWNTIININQSLQSIKPKDDGSKDDPVRNEQYKDLFQKVYMLVKHFENDKELESIINSEEYKEFKQTRENSETELKKLKAKLKEIQSKSNSPASNKSKLSEKKLSSSFKNQTNVTKTSLGNGPISSSNQQLLSSINAIEKLLKNLEDDKVTAMVRKAENIISIDDEINQGGNRIGQFFEKTEEALYKQLRDLAIKVKGANIVYEFANEKKPMSILNVNKQNENNSSTQTQVLKTTTEISSYIQNNFVTESKLNDDLVETVKSVYEPSRVTSNRNLYEVIRYFYFGETVIKAKAKAGDTEIEKKIEEYKQVINDIYDEYILETKPPDNKTYDKYLYVGTDDVNPNQPESDEKQRNAKEIYVRFDLVNADTFEKTSRAPCKLYDKELAEEFMYLIDPRNKNNRTLSRFRNLDFNSVIPDPVAAAVDPTNPNAEINQPNANDTQATEKRGGYTRRIRSANGFKTLRNYK